MATRPADSHVRGVGLVALLELDQTLFAFVGANRARHRFFGIASSPRAESSAVGPALLGAEFQLASGYEVTVQGVWTDF